MALGTFWVEARQDGKISIGIEDYDVDFFDGGDHEMIYTLDSANLQKLEDALSQVQSGTLEEMIEKEFGVHLTKKNFKEWLQDRQIDYEYFFWTSYD